MESNRFLKPGEASFLFDLSLSSEPVWSIVVVSDDGQLIRTVTDLFADDEQVRVSSCSLGCDALIACAFKKPDLLVLDDELPDIQAFFVSSCIRRHHEFGNIKILEVCQSFEQDFLDIVDDRYDKRGYDIVILERKIRFLLDITDRPAVARQRPDPRFTRRWPRVKVNVAAAVELEPEETPERILTGNAIVDNISRGGALLTEIRLDENVPLDIRYRIRFTITNPPLERLTADSTVVRVAANNRAGVKFTGISKADRERVTDLCNV